MVFMLIQWAAEMDTNVENSVGTLERLNVDAAFFPCDECPVTFVEQRALF